MTPPVYTSCITAAEDGIVLENKVQVRDNVCVLENSRVDFNHCRL